MDPITAGFEFGKALVGLFEKMVDGQTAEQRKIIWDQWIVFWGPIVNLMRPKQ